jgi:hypothetical protein
MVVAVGLGWHAAGDHGGRPIWLDRHQRRLSSENGHVRPCLLS